MHNEHPDTPDRKPTTPEPWRWQRGPFCHERLDAFVVAKEALRRGDAIGRALPRGYAPLADQLRRALLHAYCGVAEAAARSGADRRARFRTARGEAGEAANGRWGDSPKASRGPRRGRAG